MPDTITRTGPNPSGLCMCGCGRKTGLATQTRVPQGHVQGHPVRYVHGHHKRRPIEDRLRSKLVPRPNGCVEFIGSHNPGGYGRLFYDLDGIQYRVSAHRLAWTLAHGPIPDGMLVCHRCDNPPCCNVDHLFLGTNADNLRDMADKGRNYWAQRTHCSRGHLYTPESTYVYSNGSRMCRICRRVRRALLQTEAAS